MTREFIEQKEIQIQYLNLIKNDTLNPFMDILKIAAQRQMKVREPLSFHFYLHNERSKAAYRYMTQMGVAPVLENEKAEAETFAGIVLLQTQARGLNLAKEQQKVKLSRQGETTLMKRQIEAMTLQIKQLLRYKIAYCDQELLYMNDSEPSKKRGIGKRRLAFWKEWEQHAVKVSTQRRRNARLNEKQTLEEFLKV